MRPLVTMFVAGVALISGCSGGGLSVEEYAPLVEDRAATYADEITALADRNISDLDVAVVRLQRDFEGEALVEAAIDETARLASMLFAGIGDALDRYVRDLDALDAPSDLQTEHRAHIVALKASRSGIAQLLSNLTAATTFDDVDHAIAGSGFSDAQPRVVAACNTLQRAIAEEGSVVHLRCESIG